MSDTFAEATVALAEETVAMSDAARFRLLLRRVRAGDKFAAEELVRRYEPAIRRAVRIRLLNNQMRRVLDSMDICQSVLASFFRQVRANRFELESPAQLVKLLAKMADHKLIDQVRRQTAQRRGGRAAKRVEVLDDIVGDTPSPSQQAQIRERIQAVRRRLSPLELRLWELQQEGKEWKEIAAIVGGTPEALRKRLERALTRIEQEFRPEGKSTII